MVRSCDENEMNQIDAAMSVMIVRVDSVLALGIWLGSAWCVAVFGVWLL